MIRSLKSLTGALLACAALAGCGGPSSTSNPAKPAVLNFSILSAEDQASFQPLWTPLLDDLSKTVGIPVRPYFSPAYSALVQAMAYQQVQIGWYSAEPALETIRRSHGEVFARTVDTQGRDTYTSVLIVNKGSGLTLDRILKCDHSLAFGMGDPKSTSGTLAPTAFLFKPHHIDPNTCFKQVRSAAHDANLMAVGNGLLDASTNNSVGLDWAQEGTASPAAKAAFNKIKVVWTSPNLPESALVYRSDLDPDLKHKIRDFFINYGKAPGAEGERQRKILNALHYSAFNTASDDYLQPIQQMQAAVGGS
jgi:phosphonate transport system substrate-binding protein